MVRSFTHKKIWLTYLFIKIMYMFFALFVYSNFTILGDTARYIEGPTFGSLEALYNSTYMMDFFAHGISIFLGSIVANMFFVLISFLGIYYSVSRLNLNINELIFVLLVLSLPNFGVWTSIASKEAVSVFFMGILLGFIIDIVKNNPKKNYILVMFAFYLCAVFKPQYLVAIANLLIFIFLSKKLKLKGLSKLFLFTVFIGFSILLLYLFRDQINAISFTIPKHFSLDGGSTRENTIWINDFDVFWNAPYGMFIAFWGPTIEEASKNFLHLFVFLESLLIMMLFTGAIFKLFLLTIKRDSVFNVYLFSIFFIPMIWILFAHYPFGALNTGSALRYRQGFFAFLVVLFYFVYIEVKRKRVFYNCNKKKVVE